MHRPQLFGLLLGCLVMGIRTPTFPGSLDSIQSAALTSLWLLAIVLSSPTCHPRPPIRPGEALGKGRKGGDISPVSGARVLLLATLRGERGAAPVFIELCFVYTPFGAGCRPA